MNQQRLFFLLGVCLILMGLAIIGALALTPGPSSTLWERGAAFISTSSIGAQPPSDSPRMWGERGLAPLLCRGKAPNGLAQCGSQASSCKSCHEVKGEDPVNTEREWHIAHAFGDFCEFCHGGNVQAVEKAAAHQGLVQPLGDVKANCAACHDDYEAKAQVYAVALGVTLGSGSASGGSVSQPPSQPSNPSPTEPAVPPAAPVAAPGEIIDYAAQYEAAQARPVSVGNVIVGTLLALAVLGGGAFVYWNEQRLRRQAMPKLTSSDKAVMGPDSKEAVRAEAPGRLSPELEQLLPVLQSLDPRTLQALRLILADRKRGEELLQSLSLINFAMLEEMKRLDKRQLALLLALASET
ncbi:MAG: hypothetical protein C4311_13135 [Chloroflexota bacterium]